MVPAVGDPDLNQGPGQLPVPGRPGLVVAPVRHERPRASRVSEYLPFIITLLAGGIVVAIVVLALGTPSRRALTATPLPAPSVSATPAPSIGAGAGHHGSGR